MTGGEGADRLSGGLGADRFRFEAETDSGLADGTWDVILDFNRSEGDRIDLSLIDAAADSVGSNDGFSFAGSAAFSGTDATAQLNWTYDAGLRGVIVRGSTDADDAAEFALLVLRVTSLQESDFIL